MVGRDEVGRHRDAEKWRYRKNILKIEFTVLVIDRVRGKGRAF